MIRIKNPRNFASAGLFIAIGLLGIWTAQDYTFGTSARMGPGYFPILISGVLIALGLVVGAGALRVSGPKIAEIKWRPMILVLGGIIIFGSLIEIVGFIGSVLITVGVIALASDESRYKEIVLLALFLAIFCTVIFVYALNQPLTLFGGR